MTGGRITRRRLLQGATAAAFSAPLSRAAAAAGSLELTYDVVIVGAGAAGFSAAMGVLREDPKASVVLLDARPSYGGTSYRSGGRLWVPNNADLRAAGLEDPKDMALRYMARLSYPSVYDPEAPNLGLDPRHHRQLSAYYDNGAEMLDHYRAEKIMPWHVETGVFTPGTPDPLKIAGKLAPDYHPDLEEDVPKAGRSIMPELFDPTGATASDVGRLTTVGNFGASLYGPDVIEWLHYSATLRGAQVHPATRAVDLLVTNSANGMTVTGVRAATVVDGGTFVDEPLPYLRLRGDRTYKARRGVIFTSGGFSKSSAKMTAEFSGSHALTGGGCAVVSAVGDLTDMARRYGFALENMDQAWFIENVFEQYKQDSNSTVLPNYLLFQAYWLAGDSMLSVNRRGVRVVNEKEDYNTRTRVHFHPDNRFLLNVFDQHTLEHYVGVGGQLPPNPAVWIGPADDVGQLERRIAARLKRHPETASFVLDKDFARHLQSSIDRFNHFARTGVDEDFGRGGTFLDVWWHALLCLQLRPVDLPLGDRTELRDCIDANRDESGNLYPNPTMRPLAPPYYAVILSSGLQDTKGGPAIDERARVLDVSGRVVQGLYGAGNCIASPAGAGYWGAGGTLGPATVFGHIAGRNVARRGS